ncbi:MAG: hypothetical protein XE11_2094 [Methanomicrobiales archaeon 53_19]|nr:MAG: hypothetical protein XE11_2094 [Methanomicrobiales archaeon 53_19]
MALLYHITNMRFRRYFILTRMLGIHACAGIKNRASSSVEMNETPRCGNRAIQFSQGQMKKTRVLYGT